MWVPADPLGGWRRSREVFTAPVTAIAVIPGVRHGYSWPGGRGLTAPARSAMMNGMGDITSPDEQSVERAAWLRAEITRQEQYRDWALTDPDPHPQDAAAASRAYQRQADEYRRELAALANGTAGD